MRISDFGQVPWTPPPLQMAPAPAFLPPPPPPPPPSIFAQNALYNVPIASTVPLDQFTDEQLKSQKAAAQTKLDTNNFLLKNPKLSKLDIATITTISKTMQANIDRLTEALSARGVKADAAKAEADAETSKQAMIRAAEEANSMPGWLIPTAVGGGLLAIGLIWWASRD